MNNQPAAADDDNNNQQQPLGQSTSSSSRHSSRSQLLTRIYYPDTLYPNSYSFFADRGAGPSSHVPSRSPSMEPSEQYPTTTTDATAASTVPKQPATEIEIIERQSKYSSPMLDRERGESERERRQFDIKRYLPTALRPQDKTQPPGHVLDTRFYSMKKTAMTIMCLLIIIMSNSVQLKHVLNKGSSHAFYGTQVTLGIISVLMCACIGVILMYVMRVDLNDQYKQHKLDYIDNCVMCLIFVLAVFNIFIAACSFYLMYVLKINDQNVYKQRKLDFLQNLGLILLFSLFILNIVFTIFHAI